MWVHDLRDADASCGGKAVGLATLIRAGLPVPPGFVLDDGAFRAVAGTISVDDPGEIGHTLAAVAERIATAPIPGALEAEVQERIRELGSVVVVRSSATIEDGAAGAAAGVFSSRTGVAVADVWQAIRAVWTSALTPLAVAYARHRGEAARLGAIGVIVQEYVAGTPVVVYTRPPGRPESPELLVQRADHVSRFSRDDLPREIESQSALLLAIRAEAALGAEGGADVELVQLRKQSGFEVAIETVVVQARPIVHPTPRALSPAPPAIFAALADGRTWTWDIAHNPDPLSPAQQGLVERVERAGIAPWSLRVVAGYLYSASRGEPPPETTDLEPRAAALEARLEQTLKHDDTLSLAEAIERYLAFYAIWARELSPLISAARAVLPAALRRAGHEHADQLAASLAGPRASAVEATLLAAARGELDEADVALELGCLSPAWDVAVPTFGERPGLLPDAIARARLALARTELAPKVQQFAAALEKTFAREVALARCAADLAERDDTLFARAQRLVRRALLARAAELRLADDDIFWISLDDALAGIDPIDARRRASGARAAAARACQWQMPPVVGGEGGSAEAAANPTILVGVGTGPRVAGRVVRFASLASAIAVGTGDVIVTRAVTPALAVLVAGCAALVSETGGLLDHGAALARELGVPCVVGCRDAWSTLVDGMLVTVDGDAGTVTTTSTGP
ncbi:MAG: hypothetical protein HOV81_43730 [Kofleriaceae bacterium]|nr:hypothetical protein [Kofleriaceae bacterium]